MKFLFDFSPYVLAIAALAIGVFDLIKEWAEEKRSWLKVSKGITLCIVAVLSLVGVYQESKDKIEQRAATTKVEGQLDEANKALRDNTALYLTTYKDLSGQVTDLKTQVKTDELQKKLTSVETQLEATQRALVGPKATLAFSFDPPSVSSDGNDLIPVTQTILPVADSGAVHMSFDVINNTTIDAVDGELTLQICDGCKFGKEPDGSRKLQNAPETQRDFPFQRILPKTRVSFGADLIVPPKVPWVTVVLSYRCQTCVIPMSLPQNKILLQRETLRVPASIRPFKAKSYGSPAR